MQSTPAIAVRSSRTSRRHRHVRRATTRRGVRGLAAYRDLWQPFFEWQRQGTELEVAAGNDVAFAWALLRCGPPDELESDPANRPRLTIGLRKQDGRWLVTHEHHSFPDCD